ncbi:Matrix metalloproteinase-24 [Habropoda laboriosa]|uniref:Matrix metalloproteinase-24 n=1 Tax=Habropoda laboriosa TaxID=597456 RepID=A0A0L7R172_9HYME|nr:PREDICTED: matrix metalloproteinase-2-like [Habropoda laboriosa]KOC64593.1 Matrix metalloproteinase-24 [Habropoda laboriosa]
MELSCVIFCILFIAGQCESAAIQPKINTTSPSLSAMNFMEKYGYLEGGHTDSAALYTENAITEAVKTLQKFGNIVITGQLDNATLELMASPRCGVPDILKKEEHEQPRK